MSVFQDLWKDFLRTPLGASIYPIQAQIVSLEDQGLTYTEAEDVLREAGMLENPWKGIEDSLAEFFTGLWGWIKTYLPWILGAILILFILYLIRPWVKEH